jgi:hypothetical protein
VLLKKREDSGRNLVRTTHPRNVASVRHYLELRAWDDLLRRFSDLDSTESVARTPDEQNVLPKHR